MGVDLRGVSCLFGRTPAVRDIDLSVASGEFLSLVGPSGAGKTTLLRVIAGLEAGFDGGLSINGRDVTRVPARDRNIGFVFQNYALFGHMTVADNVAFGLKVRPRRRRPGRAAIAARVADLLELVRVAPLAHRFPAQLSGGQRQRVALARALATEPELLLLDEPFGALDPLVRKDIRTWLRGLHDRLGLTSILVTHDQNEALEVADRIAVLRDGRIEQVGTPSALDSAPATPFVHRFLGETLGFPATAGNGVLRLDGPWRDSDAVLPAGVPPDGPVLLSVRAHAVGVLPAQAGSQAAVMLEQRPAGPFLRCRVAPSDGGGDEAVSILVPAGGAVPPPGRRCRLDLGAAHLFPPAARAPATVGAAQPQAPVPA